MNAFSLPPYPWFRNRHKNIYLKFMLSVKVTGEDSKQKEESGIKKKISYLSWKQLEQQ